MRKECKELLKANNEREKLINKENDEVYTNMVVYMRGSDIDEYNQEKVRADLIEMIIDGQQRHEDIEKVMGGNYKEICDEIIATFPKKTKKQKLMEMLTISLSSLWILVGISIVQSLVVNLIKGESIYSYGVTVGNLLNMVLITVVANAIVIYTCKQVFDKPNKNKVLEFIKLWVIAMIIIGSCMLLTYFLDFVIIKTSIIYAIIFVAIIFCSERIISSKV